MTTATTTKMERWRSEDMLGPLVGPLIFMISVLLAPFLIWEIIEDGPIWFRLLSIIGIRQLVYVENYNGEVYLARLITTPFGKIVAKKEWRVWIVNHDGTVTEANYASLHGRWVNWKHNRRPVLLEFKTPPTPPMVSITAQGFKGSRYASRQSVSIRKGEKRKA